MSSWERSACYPRSTFYPLSDGPSIRCHRITKPNFRSCSACMPCSQAPLCFYTLRTIADRAEGTFGSLRYILGGDRPSQTTHHTMSPDESGLESTCGKGGISRATPQTLARPLHRLPPILHMQQLEPM